MFTGLVRDTGTLRRLEKGGDLRVEIAPSDAKFPLAVGASIACNGVCLTVISITGDHAFTASLSAETLRVTTAGSWKEGMKINLEPSLAAGDALGGHFVAGHVDGTARLVSRKAVGDSVVLEFETGLKLTKFLAQKGSVALDGVSLTVNSVTGNRFTVNIIPHTAQVTNIDALGTGETVNLEIDLVARYVARLMEAV